MIIIILNNLRSRTRKITFDPETNNRTRDRNVHMGFLPGDIPVTDKITETSETIGTVKKRDRYNHNCRDK